MPAEVIFLRYLFQDVRWTLAETADDIIVFAVCWTFCSQSCH